MSSIEFIYKENKIVIQCDLNDRMKDIINKYILKTSINKSSVIFLYSGYIINEELKLSEIVGKDKIDKINILVYSIDNIINNKSKIKSKYIICPKCEENIRFKLNDYRINLYECKNGHRIENIFLDEFEKTQYIDISKIECNICQKKNKSNTYNNEFYLCLACGINICPLCKSSHDNLHNIINYEEKNYICEKHNEVYIKYCAKCKINICIMYEKDHKNHKNISFRDIIPNNDKINEYMKELRKSIDIFNKNIENIIKILRKVKENIEIYYNISNHIINNYIVKKRNYEILQNINEITNNNIIEEINKINHDEDIYNKLNNIINIYNKMINKDITEINIIYDISEEIKRIEEDEWRREEERNWVEEEDNWNYEEDDWIEEEEEEEYNINIFGKEFAKNNKNKCKMIIDNEEYEIKEQFNIRNYKNNILKIKLKGIDNITNMSYMFSDCSFLSYLPDISKWNTNNVTNMSHIFYKCTLLSSLPDISKWNTKNVTDMSSMFNMGCIINQSSLSSLPNISKWNTSNVFNMSHMFSCCLSLTSLPDISKWNTFNVINMSSMFSHCPLLTSLPDISKWNTNNVTDMSYMFSGCRSLSSLPNISKWNTNRVTNMGSMFKMGGWVVQSSLTSLPYISK